MGKKRCGICGILISVPGSLFRIVFFTDSIKKGEKEKRQMKKKREREREVERRRRKQGARNFQGENICKTTKNTLQLSLAIFYRYLVSLALRCPTLVIIRYRL